MCEQCTGVVSALRAGGIPSIVRAQNMYLTFGKSRKGMPVLVSRKVEFSCNRTLDNGVFNQTGAANH